MQNDIQAALGLLALAATGRAFMWANPLTQHPHGYRAIVRVKIYAQTTLDGKEEYEASAMAADCTAITLIYGAPTLADVFAQAYTALKALPLAADVIQHEGLPPSVHVGQPANDAVPPAAEGVA